MLVGNGVGNVLYGQGGNDYLDGDAMLRVRLTDGTNFYDSAAQLQAAEDGLKLAEATSRNRLVFQGFLKVGTGF